MVKTTNQIASIYIYTYMPIHTKLRGECNPAYKWPAWAKSPRGELMWISGTRWCFPFFSVLCLFHSFEMDGHVMTQVGYFFPGSDQQIMTLFSCWRPISVMGPYCEKFVFPNWVSWCLCGVGLYCEFFFAQIQFFLGGKNGLRKTIVI